MMEILERSAAFSGIGQSEVGRRLGRDPLELTLDACVAAIEDAGLARDDIDGLSTYPGMMTGAPGFSGAGISDVHDALRLMTNIVHCPAEDVRVGMPVRVVFEEHEDVFIPLFEPAP